MFGKKKAPSPSKETQPIISNQNDDRDEIRGIQEVTDYRSLPTPPSNLGFHSGKDTSSDEYNFNKSLLVAFLYIFIGVLAYSHVFEKWTMIDALFFTMVSFSTIGYGDLNPTSDLSRAFTTVFGLSGIAVLGFALNRIGERISENRRHEVQQARQLKIMTLLHQNKTDLSIEIEAEKTVRAIILDEIATHIFYIISLLIMGIGIGYYEGWTIITSIYYVTITATTTGYGDIEPITQPMRLFCSIVFIPIAVCTMGSLLGGIGSGIVSMEEKKADREFFRRKLTIDDIIAMDSDHDGKVSKHEFLKYMLIALKKVDEETIKDIMTLFNRLDTKNEGILRESNLPKQNKSIPKISPNIV